MYAAAEHKYLTNALAYCYTYWLSTKPSSRAFKYVNQLIEIFTGCAPRCTYCYHLAWARLSTWSIATLIVKMVLSVYAKQRILLLFWDGIKSSTAIKKRLKREDRLNVSRQAIWKFLRDYCKSGGCIGRKEGSGRPSKISEEVKRFVEQKMLEDDETTATQLKKLLRDRGHSMSISTILRCRKVLGWTYRGM